MYYRRMYYVYLLQCKGGSLYTGITTDVKRRFKEHKEGKGALYTRMVGVVRILYTEEHPDRSSATKREAAIKRWPRHKKKMLAKSSKKK
jgi:putative endonuclease